MDKLHIIVSNFQLEGQIEDIRPFGNGLINDSYLVTTLGESDNYILQCINHAIFQDVDMLQSNIDAVTTHIRRKLIERNEQDIDRKVLRFIDTKQGAKYHFTGESYWRMMVYIPNSVCYEAITAEYSRYAGLAFGEFQSMLADIPIELGETIVDFHNMEFRLKQLRDAVEHNRVGRLDEVKDIVAQIDSYSHQMVKAEELHRQGELPKRICHCDTKVNNILFDKGGEILCVIDLDTVMPSYIFSDYGDFLRTGANTGAEDERNLDNVSFNLDIFKAFTEGYLQGAKSFLTQIEVDNLPYAAAMFPYMQAVRFLADYINGDTYYKIEYPEHNLVRTKAQMKLFFSVLDATSQMKEFIESIRN